MRISDGKTAKSSDRLICIATSRISSDAVMFRPSSRSSTAAGSGTTSMRTMATTPMGTAALVIPRTGIPSAAGGARPTADGAPVTAVPGSGGDRGPAPAGPRQVRDVGSLEAGPVEAAAHAAGTELHDEGEHAGDGGEQLRRHL